MRKNERKNLTTLIKSARLFQSSLKRNLGVDAFFLRGRDGAKAEASLLASCFNIRRMITLIGARVLIKKFKNLASFKGAFVLDRWNFALGLPSPGLESLVYPKQEIREQCLSS